MKDVIKAKELLKDEITMVLVKDDNVIDSKENGIKPLLNLIDSNIFLNGYSIADKIVGKAQAMLIVKAKISEVYAKTISKQAENILNRYNIPYTYDNLTDVIINRDKTDICPMEKAVKDIDDIDKAYIALKNTVKRMMGDELNGK